MFVFLGRALFQIITVPPDKGKFQSANDNKSSTGTVHRLILYLIILTLIYIKCNLFCGLDTVFLYVSSVICLYRLYYTREEVICQYK